MTHSGRGASVLIGVIPIALIIGGLGFALDAAFEALRSRLVRWAEPSHDLVVGTT